MTLAVFHDFQGLENGLTKFHDFPWLSKKSGHPGLELVGLALWFVWVSGK